jgi:hypothetical protein
VNGGGCPSKYAELEEQWHGWIFRKNAMGLCAKDHVIQQKTLNLFKVLSPEVQAGEEFKTPPGLLSNFKNRKRLVSRQTSRKCR